MFEAFVGDDKIDAFHDKRDTYHCSIQGKPDNRELTVLFSGHIQDVLYILRNCSGLSLYSQELFMIVSIFSEIIQDCLYILRNCSGFSRDMFRIN